MYDINDTPYLSKWTPYRGKFTFLVRFLLLIAFFYGANMLASVPATFASFFTISWKDYFAIVEAGQNGSMTWEAMWEALTALANTAASHPLSIFFNMIGQGSLFAGILLFVTLIERRRAASIGVSGGVKHGILTGLAGAGIGIVAPLAIFGICFWRGSVQVVGVYNNGLWLPLFAVALLINALAEEILYRGFFLSLFMRPGRSPWPGIAVVSLFSVIPYVGLGLNVFVLLNAALMGLLLCILTIRTGSIWLSASLSAMWNFMMFCIFGDVYGIPTIWRLLPVGESTLISGGTNGITAGLVATLVLLVILVLALFIPSWKKSYIQRIDPSSMYQ